MSLNKYMHKRNPFRNKKIDFKYFSEKYEFFREIFLNIDNFDKVTIDFKSPSHIAAISRALLLDTMKLDVYLPLDRLIPTIPLRMNYVLWVEDLLSCAPMNEKIQINVFDVGCGASCIYPLLGSSKNNWNFKTSEIDELNLVIAKENINKNNLNEKIEVIHVDENDPVILGHAFSKGSPISYIHCVMCNPPFYTDFIDKTSILSTRNHEERDSAKSINTSIRRECLTDGGDIQFTIRMIDESILYQNKIGIVTVMLGKKSSSEKIKKYLLTKSITNHSIYEFCQGRVMRWGVAWSFLPNFKHPKSEFQLNRETNRPPLLWNIPMELPGISEYSVNGIYGTLKQIFNKLEIEFLEQKNKQSQGGGVHLLITAKKNTWSHQRRKRRELQKLTKVTYQDEIEITEEPETKRRKLDLICSEAIAIDCEHNESRCSDSSFYDCILKCSFNAVIIVENNIPIIQLQVKYIDGEKEAMNQVLTFIKNTLKNTDQNTI